MVVWIWVHGLEDKETEVLLTRILSPTCQPADLTNTEGML